MTTGDNPENISDQQADEVVATPATPNADGLGDTTDQGALDSTDDDKPQS